MPPRLYPSHGSLNDVHKPVVQDRVDLVSSTAAGTLRRSIERTYTPNSTNNTGPYKAIVLKVETDSAKPQAGSWVSTFFGSLFGDKSSPKLVRVKARIPEIHAMLPVPKTIGSSGENAIIEMYPTFIGQHENMEIPEDGQLIWVDFGNKTNFTDPIYLGPVLKTNNKAGAHGKKGAAAAHQEGCAGPLNAKSPLGDPLSGKNKPLSHSGVPLVPRVTNRSISQESKQLIGFKASPDITTKWDSAIKSSKVPGTSWIGVLESNGRDDKQHKRGKRETIIFAPNTTDFTVSTELIYFFHGLKEFDTKDFKKRFAPQITTLSQGKRNFVLVIPELPWSKDGTSNRTRVNQVWTGDDNFSNFHNQVLSVLKNSFSQQASPDFITIVAHSAGGKAIMNLSVGGELDRIKPRKIVLSDCDYYGVTQEVWDRYVKNNLENVEYNILTGVKGTPFTKSQEFLSKTNLPGNSEKVYVKALKEPHFQIGNIALTFVNPVPTQKAMEGIKKVLEETKNNPINPDDPGFGDNSLVEDNPYAVKNKPPTQPVARAPIGSNAPIAPSSMAKNSLTSKPLPPDAIIKPAEPFKEARVFLKDYGQVPQGSPLLMKVPSVSSQQYLHILAANRLQAMNEAWLRDNPGSPPIKIASGWRARRWASREQYEQVLINKYASRFGNDRQKALQEGPKWLAFASPHETGLAFDIGNNDLQPISATNEIQKRSTLYKWLANNAHKFGITPYIREAWHWEVRLPRESWASGKEFTDNFAVLVVQSGKGGTLPTAGTGGAPCITTMADAGNTIGTGPNAVSAEQLSKMIGPPNTKGVLSTSTKKDLITRLSNQIGIEPEIAYAFFTVESGGKSGFCANTGRPIIRFEPHVFANPERMRQAGVADGACPWAGSSAEERKRKWKELGFQHGTNCTTNKFEYESLAAAIKINEELAYASTSTGAAQIMGFNYKTLGFKSAKDMFNNFAQSEESQIKGFFVYVVKRAGGKMLDALKNKDLVKAALLYNGKGQETLYASKIEKYYNMYKEKGLPA